MSVIFDDGKLVFQQKKKVLEMSDLMGSKSVIRRSDYNINEFRKFVEDYLYINDNEFEFMNRSNEAPTNHNELFLTEISKNEITRRKSNIQFQEQITQINRRTSTINDYAYDNMREEQALPKRQIEELVHNKIGKFVKENFQE